MRVLVTCPMLEIPGGVANYYRVLRRHFTSDVKYFIVGARLNEVGLLNKVIRFCSDCFLFARMLNRSNYDLVHLNPSLVPYSLIRDGLFLVIAKVFRKKVIVFMRGWDQKWERNIRRFFPWLFRAVYFRSDAFIVLSTEFKDRLQEMGYSGPIFVETTVVEDDIFSSVEAVPGMLEVKITDNKINILYLAHIERAKGIYEAVDAYRILKGLYPHVMLTIAGNGIEAVTVKSYVEEKGIPDVMFLGYVTGEAKRNAFKKGDIYLFPSYSEGMPNSVLEAMAYGLPIVTTAVGGLRDFFKNSEMGFITESTDAQTFVELIETLINNPEACSRIGRHNKLYAKEHFAASKVIKRLLKIYHSV